MKKIYPVFFTFFVATVLFAQKKEGIKYPFTRQTSASRLTVTTASGNLLGGISGCDTLINPVPSEWNITAYYTENDGVSYGFITGVNGYGDQEKAGYYDASSTSDKYLTEVHIYFAVANSSIPAHLTKVVPIHVYDGTSGEPGTLLSTINKTFSDIKADVDNRRFTVVKFPSSIALPASKKFFISIDLKNLQWNSSPVAGNDSLAIYSSDPKAYTPDSDTNGFGWEKNSDGDWATFSDDGWFEDYALIIQPVICTDAVLPVHLLSFTAGRQDNKNVINWTTATEAGNAGFTLERSADGVNFTAIATIASKGQGGNSSLPLSYTYNDGKGIADNNYYRLKQTDMSGRESYSSIINVKAAATQFLHLLNVWPSPATSYIHVLLSSPSADKIQLTIVDLSGRVVAQQTQQVAAGDNNVILPVQGLSPGTYFIKAGNSNSKFGIRKFVKE